MDSGSGHGHEVGDAEEDVLLASSSSSSSSEKNSDAEDANDGVEGKKNNAASSDESSSSDDDMDTDDQATLLKLGEINEKLLSDPNSYELQVEKIQTLKALGDLDALREAREKLNEVYPLSPELWMNWIQDELSLLSDTEESELVTSLFERAVKDYLSIDIWLAYAQFCLRKLDEPEGVVKCRDVFERSLSACGLHATSGVLLWEAFGDFEAALLGTFTASDKLEEQEKRYITLCRRQLSVPLVGMEVVYENLSTKIDIEIIDDATDTGYQKALEKLKIIQPWEEKLSKCIDINGKTETFKGYIDVEKKSKSNPARLVCLYERALAELPLDGSLWLDYIEYVSQILPIQDIVLETVKRASRNCPWVLQIWIKYMGCVEKFIGDKDQLKEIFEKAILYCTTGDDAGIVWLRYIEFLRRKIDYDNLVEADVQLFNKTLSAAEDYLLQLVEEPNDCICDIILFRVRVATHIAKSLDSAKELWTDIFQRGYGKQYKVWSQYLMLEKQYGNLKSIRRHFERGLNSAQDNAQSVADLWLSYERDFGDLKSMDTCIVKVDAWKEKMAYQVQFDPMPTENDVRLKRKRNDQQPDNFKGKRSRPGFGFSKSEDKVDSDSATFKVPFVPRQEQHSKKPDAGRNTNSKGQQSAASSNNRNPPLEEKGKFDPKDNDKTAFLSNLSFSVDEEQIRGFLVSCGTVNQVRLIKDFQGRSKGYAYVTFSSQEEAKLALEKDREKLDGRPVFVSECTPDKSTRPVKFKFATGLEKNKLFVKGLPLTTTEDHLRALFTAFGNVTDVRLVTFRNGHSKGMAFVDFADVGSATAALEKIDGKEFEGNVLSVAVSNPPKRPSKADDEPPAMTRRTAKPFVPRSLQVKSDPKAVKPVTGEKVAMNNQDFRQFFLKPAAPKSDTDA